MVFVFKAEFCKLIELIVLILDVNSDRDEDPTFFSMEPDPAQLKKNSGSDLKSKGRKKYIYI